MSHIPRPFRWLNRPFIHAREGRLGLKTVAKRPLPPALMRKIAGFHGKTQASRQVARALCDAGCDRDVQDELGRGSLSLAVHRNDLVQLLWSVQWRRRAFEVLYLKEVSFI